MNRVRHWLGRLRELDREGELGLFSWTGCVSASCVFLAFMGVVMAVAFAIQGCIAGLLMIFAILLAGILMVLATKEQGG